MRIRCDGTVPWAAQSGSTHERCGRRGPSRRGGYPLAGSEIAGSAPPMTCAPGLLKAIWRACVCKMIGSSAIRALQQNDRLCHSLSRRRQALPAAVAAARLERRGPPEGRASSAVLSPTTPTYCCCWVSALGERRQPAERTILMKEWRLPPHTCLRRALQIHPARSNCERI